LSPRAKEWLKIESVDFGDKERLVISAIESVAAKSLRKSIIDKYAKLKIGSGSDSVELIREARDER
jgi:tRNA-binding EMAP/Myf-like protein